MMLRPHVIPHLLKWATNFNRFFHLKLLLVSQLWYSDFGFRNFSTILYVIKAHVAHAQRVTLTFLETYYIN